MSSDRVATSCQYDLHGCGLTDADELRKKMSADPKHNRTYGLPIPEHNCGRLIDKEFGRRNQGNPDTEITPNKIE